MRSMADMERDIANISYEIANDINEPEPDFKGFNMSDYIKSQKITSEKIAAEEQAIEKEKIAAEEQAIEGEKTAAEKITKKTLKKEDPKVQEEYKKNYGLKDRIKDSAIGAVGETVANTAAYKATNKVLGRKIDTKPFGDAVKKYTSDNQLILDKIKKGLKPGEREALLKTMESNKAAMKTTGKALARQAAPAIVTSTIAGGVVKHLNKKRVEKKKQEILNKARQKYQ